MSTNNLIIISLGLQTMLLSVNNFISEINPSSGPIDEVFEKGEVKEKYKTLAPGKSFVVFCRQKIDQVYFKKVSAVPVVVKDPKNPVWVNLYSQEYLLSLLPEKNIKFFTKEKEGINLAVIFKPAEKKAKKGPAPESRPVVTPPRSKTPDSKKPLELKKTIKTKKTKSGK